MALTPDQRDLFDKLNVGVKLPGGEFTSEQVRKLHGVRLPARLPA